MFLIGTFNSEYVIVYDIMDFCELKNIYIYICYPIVWRY